MAAAARRRPTLIVDNFDSYTHNLYQVPAPPACPAAFAPACACRSLSLSSLVTQHKPHQMCWSVSGLQPIVIRNNEEELFRSLQDQQAFDNIIVSPGPGSPDKFEVSAV
jgi:anthranilate/para-aminobenzoate synthase component II